MQGSWLLCRQTGKSIFMPLAGKQIPGKYLNENNPKLKSLQENKFL
jgi:hypothetical protein